MSSILKALRKVEEQKQGKREMPIALERQILKGTPGKDSRILLVIVAAMVIGGAAAGLVTFVLMGGLQGKKGNVEVMTTGRQVEHAETSPEPAPTVAIRHEPTSGKAPAFKKAEPLHQPPPSPTEPIAIRDAEQEAATAPAPLAEIAPSLVVSGIAYQRDNSSRVAVVNGQPVMEGGTVSGCRVEQILPDRVRFQVQDRIVEIVVGKPTQ